MLIQVLFQRLGKKLTSGYAPLFCEAFCGPENRVWNGDGYFHCAKVSLEYYPVNPGEAQRSASAVARSAVRCMRCHA